MTGAEGSSALNDPLIGQVIQGRYRVGRTLGRGGMGVVYEAEHLLIGRKVAIKTLTARGSLSSAGSVRFRREAQAAASVGNSHVVDVLDMGQLDDGTLFIVLEHLDGVHLGWAVAESRRFSVQRAVRVLCQLCDALSAVHAAGIVHRDLKPENIFLIQRDGEPDFVKVLDFGVCKFNDAQGVSLTASGDMVGTPLFMAPEQVENLRDIDHRTDVYALGAILHFLLTGLAPFDAATLPKLFIRICTEPPPSLRAVDDNLPHDLDVIVQRALSKSREQRFESCLALKHALLPFSDAAGPASGMRMKEQLAQTLPSNTAAVYMGDAKPDDNTVEVVELPMRRGLGLAQLSPGRALALALLAAALLAALLLRAPKPSAAAAVATPLPKMLPLPPLPPAARGSGELREPTVTDARAATKPTSTPRRHPNQRAATHGAPALDAALQQDLPREPPPLPSVTSASDEPPPPAASAPAASIAAPAFHFNRGPKRGL
jgi:serine/threonine-protein kinase